MIEKIKNKHIRVGIIQWSKTILGQTSFLEMIRMEKSGKSELGKPLVHYEGRAKSRKERKFETFEETFKKY